MDFQEFSTMCGGKMDMLLKSMRCFCFCVFVCMSAVVVGQEAVVPCGGTAKGDNGEVSFSLGQAIVLCAEDDLLSFMAGVQQQSDFISTYVPAVGMDGLEVSLYPNPVRDVLNVQCDKANTTDVFSVRVFDEKGAYVKTFKIMDKLTEIDMSRLPVGVYMLVLANADGVVVRYFKVVKI